MATYTVRVYLDRRVEVEADSWEDAAEAALEEIIQDGSWSVECEAIEEEETA